MSPSIRSHWTTSDRGEQTAGSGKPLEPRASSKEARKLSDCKFSTSRARSNGDKNKSTSLLLLLWPAWLVTTLLSSMPISGRAVGSKPMHHASGVAPGARNYIARSTGAIVLFGRSRLSLFVVVALLWLSKEKTLRASSGLSL